MEGEGFISLSEAAAVSGLSWDSHDGFIVPARVPENPAAGGGRIKRDGVDCETNSVPRGAPPYRYWSAGQHC